MPQQPVSTSFLHVYDVESGLWASLTLDSSVCLRIREAMNVILKQDGILAYIGTKSEFGLYLSELQNDRQTDFRHSWTSLPGSTVMSMLGLCLNMPKSGRPSLVFNGSPLILGLAYMLDLSETNLTDPTLLGTFGQFEDFCLEISTLESLGIVSDCHILASEIQEAYSYLCDHLNVDYKGVVDVTKVTNANMG